MTCIGIAWALATQVSDAFVRLVIGLIGYGLLRASFDSDGDRDIRGGQRSPGVIYVSVTTFGLEARDCAERLRRAAGNIHSFANG